MGKNTSTQPKEKNPSESFVVNDLSEFGEVDPKEVSALENFVEEIPIEVAISNEDKQKIENILFLGRTSKTVEIGGHNFELSTLTHKEHNTLAEELVKMGDKLTALNVRIYTLSSALRSIDGVKLGDFKIDQEFNTPFEKNVYLLDNMQLKVIEKLFEEYNMLLEQTEKIVSGDVIKK